MHHIPLPAIDDAAVFTNCTAVKAGPLRARFAACEQAIHDASSNYRLHAEAGSLIDVETIVNATFGVSAAELRALYTSQFSDKRGPERRTYEKLLLASPRCPFCSHHRPKSLDHYLPKESFPEFSVFSLNLVPCCRDCNSEKHNRVLTEDGQFVHPYWDDVGIYTWLHCSMTFESQAPDYNFDVNANAGIPDHLFAKMRYQLRELELSQLYALQAANEVGGVTQLLVNIFDSEGPAGVRHHLEEAAASKTAYDRNGWQAALYRCLAANDRFCAMDWEV